MKKRGASLLYVCRLCGHQFAPFHVPDGSLVLRAMHGEAVWPQGQQFPAPGPVEAHQCSPTQRGEAYFVGIQFDEA